MSIFALRSNGLASSAYKNLSRAQTSLNENISRLASGLRINKTADDSAGSSVAVRMANQIGGMKQANANAQQANNLLQTAESGLSDISDILGRMRELSVQASTDTLNDADRDSIDLEFQALKDEITRIAKATEYDDNALLDGSYTNKSLQIGADNDANHRLGISIGNVTDVGLGLEVPEATQDLGSHSFVVDSGNVNIQLSLSSTGWEGTGGWTDGGSGIYVGPHVSVQPSGFNTPDGDDYFVRNYTGASSSKYAITKTGENTITSAERGSIEFTADWAANSTLGARFVAVVDGTWYGSDQLGMAADDHGNMNQTEVTDWEVDVSVNADTDNWYASLAGAPNGYDWRDGNQWNANPVAGGGLPTGDITQVGFAWLQTGNGHYGAVDNFRVTTTDESYSADVDTVDNARTAITKLDHAIDVVNTERSKIGAVQNRLSFTISNLSNHTQAIEAGRSSIEDVDFAAEAADLAKNQILAQSATAMLAQASAISQNVLGLLS